MADSYFIDHIAFPEIYIDYAAKSIRLYFHGRTGYKPNGGQIQGTRVAESSDGLTFTVQEPLLGPAYFRVFRQNSAFCAFARTADLLRSPDEIQPFASLGIPNGFPEDIRHIALSRRSKTEMTMFHAVIGESPEVIYACPFRMDGDPSDRWAGDSIEIMRPEFDYEGAELPLIRSERGAIDIRANQLRDPGIFVDDDRTIYMPYGIAGEAGIALAKVTKEL